MSIRLIAEEIYRLHREVAKLEKQLQGTKPHLREKIESQLRKARSDYAKMKDVLNGHLDRKSP